MSPPSSTLDQLASACSISEEQSKSSMEGHVGFRRGPTHFWAPLTTGRVAA